MRSKKFQASFVATTCVAAFLVAIEAGPAPQAFAEPSRTKTTPMSVRAAVAHDVSRSLRSLHEWPHQGLSAALQNPSPTPAPPIMSSPAGANAVEQNSQGSRPAAMLVESFDGLGVGFKGPQGEAILRNPSDNSLAIGPDHIFQIVNVRMAIYAKKGRQFKQTGRVLYGPVATNTLFKGFGGACESTLNGDAVVRYDQLANRWLVVMPTFRRGQIRPDQPRPGRDGEPAQASVPGQKGQPGAAAPLFVPTPSASPAPPQTRGQNTQPGPQGPYSMCYAVSTTSDPLGSYYRYEFLRPLFPDYPRPAVCPMVTTFLPAPAMR